MFKKLSQKSIITIIIAILLIMVGASVGIFYMKNHRSTGNPSGKKQTEFSFYEINIKDLGNPNDVGVMIMDCDETSYFTTLKNASVTSRTGKYVQGKGALEVGSILKEGQTSGVFKDSVDISEYKNGSVHVSLYISDPVYLSRQPLTLELTSGGTFDVDELAWKIPASVLKPGWNELYLGMKDAVTMGNPDYTAINFCRMYTSNGQFGLNLLIDSVYATDTKGMSLEDVKDKNVVRASTKPGLLLDFDSLDGLYSSTDLRLSKAKGEYKEGTGAVIISSPRQNWIMADLKPIDLTDYKSGKISYQLYINDASCVKKGYIYLEISSSGTYDKNELSWKIPGSELKTGWNEVTFDFFEAAKTKDAIDYKNVNYLRVFALDCSSELVTIMDAVRVMKPVPRVPSDGMILNFDSLDKLKVHSSNTFHITKAAGEYKEGSGAFKSVGNGLIWCQAQFTEMVDISAFSTGGIHLWLYVKDVSMLKADVKLEISSSGVQDQDEYQWNITGLKNGWNELSLAFDDAIKAGNPNLAQLNFFRMHAQTKGNVTVIIDDVRAIKEIPKKVKEPGVLFDCDSVIGLSKVSCSTGGTFSVTSETGEYKVGDGAFKTVGTAQQRNVVVFGTSVDISKYKDGYLQFYLYVGDVSKYASTKFTVELTSSGKSDANELSWAKDLKELKSNEWNKVTFKFADGKPLGGDIDFSAVNYFRLYLNKAETNAELTTILDDVRAVVGEAPDSGDKEEDKEDSKDEETVILKDIGQILSCDTKDGLTNISSGSGYVITSTSGEFVEGQGAIKSVGPGQVRFGAQFEPVNISKYQTGGIQMKLFIGDTSKFLEGNTLQIELRSSGSSSETNELQWSVPVSELTSNTWNVVSLKFSEGGSKTIDYTAVNYFRIYTGTSETGSDVKMIIDDVRAVPTIPSELVWGLDTADGLTLSKGSSTSVAITNKENEIFYGTGALKVEGSGLIWFTMQSATPVDISNYRNGSLKMRLYVDDVAKLPDEIKIELNSSGTVDQDELQWSVAKSTLQNGWNEMKLDFEDGNPKGTFEYASAQFLRIYGTRTGNMTAIIDDVRVVPNAPSKLIWGLDTADGLTISKGSTTLSAAITNTESEIFYGTGALKIQKPGLVWFSMVSKMPVDIAEYKKGGLRLRLYISDAAKLPNTLVVELTSSGTNDNGEIQWPIAKSKLQTGWNELKLDFANGDQAKGPIDFTKVNFMRIYGIPTGELTAIVDDIRAVPTP